MTREEQIEAAVEEAIRWLFDGDGCPDPDRDGWPIIDRKDCRVCVREAVTTAIRTLAAPPPGTDDARWAALEGRLNREMSEGDAGMNGEPAPRPLGETPALDHFRALGPFPSSALITSDAAPAPASRSGDPGAPTHSDTCIGRVHDSLGCSCGVTERIVPAPPPASGDAPTPNPEAKTNSATKENDHA